MSQSSIQQPPGTALVTGASSGIGYEFALLLARHGYDLVLVARNRAALESLARRIHETHAVKAQVYAQDLSVPAAADELYADLQRKDVCIDVLINDAGFAIQGALVQNDIANLLDMLQVNIVTLTHLTRLLLPQMISRGYGKVLNMASIGSFMPGPLMAAYFASKAYVLSLSEALANELRGSGVTITALCPGPTRTRFAQRARLTETRAFRGHLMDAAKVAQQGFNAMMKGKTVVITGLKHRLQLIPCPLVPRRLLAYFARQYHETQTVLDPHAAQAWAAAQACEPTHAAQS